MAERIEQGYITAEICDKCDGEARPVNPIPTTEAAYIRTSCYFCGADTLSPMRVVFRGA